MEGGAQILTARREPAQQWMGISLSQTNAYLVLEWIEAGAVASCKLLQSL